VIGKNKQNKSRVHDGIGHVSDGTVNVSVGTLNVSGGSSYTPFHKNLPLPFFPFYGIYWGME
jgi:hypothetical protein